MTITEPTSTVTSEAPPGGLTWSDLRTGAHLEIEHGTMRVPLDHADTGGRWIDIAVTRRRADDPTARRGVLMAINGGPGGCYGLGCAFPEALASSRLGRVFDLVGFDPRGTGDSTPVLADIVAPEAPFDSRPGDELLEVLAQDALRRERACHRSADLMPHVTTRNIARDIDCLRDALGEDRISFIGYTYGTYLGAVFGEMFPDRLFRLVLDSCVHPGWDWREQAMAQGRAGRANVELWADWTARRHERFGLGRDAAAVLDRVEAAAALLGEQVENRPLRSLYDGAVGNRSADRSRWADLADLVGVIADADADAAVARAWRLLATERVWPPVETEGETRSAVLEAVTSEKPWPRDPAVYERDVRLYRERYPYGYGALRATPWVGTFLSYEPSEPPTDLSVRRYPQGLVVHADGDPVDAYEGGAAMASFLDHRLVTVEDCGQHEIFSFARNAEVDAIVEAFLVDGVLPDSDVRCASGVPRPDVAPDEDAMHTQEVGR